MPHHLITTPIGIPSPEQAPPRYSSELATTPRHGTHPPLGQLPPPLEHRPSSPVTLPSFNSFIRGCSSPAPHSHGPHDPILLTRHPPIQNGPLSSGPLLKSWKSENISMVIDPPSPSPALAGQQLNVPAPSLPSGYPGYAHSTPPFSSPLVLICYPGCVSFSVIPNASRASRLRSSNSLLWNSTESASHSISIFRSPTLLPSKGTKPRTSRVSPSRNLPEDTCPDHPRPQKMQSSLWRPLPFLPRTLPSKHLAVAPAFLEKRSASPRHIEKTSPRPLAPSTLRAVSIWSSTREPLSFPSASSATPAITARKRASSTLTEPSTLTHP